MRRLSQSEISAMYGGLVGVRGKLAALATSRPIPCQARPPQERGCNPRRLRFKVKGNDVTDDELIAVTAAILENL